MMYFQSMTWEIIGPESGYRFHTTPTQGVLRITIIRNAEDIKRGDIKEQRSRNLVYWNWQHDSPKMKKSCMDEALPIGLVLSAFFQAFHVTPENYFQKMVLAGKSGSMTKEEIKSTMEDRLRAIEEASTIHEPMMQTIVEDRTEYVETSIETTSYPGFDFELVEEQDSELEFEFETTILPNKPIISNFKGR